MTAQRTTLRTATRIARRGTSRQRRWLAPLLLALACSAQAHDTWFAPLPPGPQGELVLALGTGARFPRQETPLDKDLIRASGCQVRGTAQPAATTPLQWVSYRPDAMLLRSAQSAQPHLRHSCWLEAQPLSITLDDATVETALAANSQLLPKPQTLAEADKAYADGIQQFRSIAKSIGLQAQ